MDGFAPFSSSSVWRNELTAAPVSQSIRRRTVCRVADSIVISWIGLPSFTRSAGLIIVGGLNSTRTHGGGVGWVLAGGGAGCRGIGASTFVAKGFQSIQSAFGKQSTGGQL